MSFDATRVDPMGPTFDLLKPPTAGRSAASVRFADALHQAASVGTVPASPPPELARQVDAAAQRYDWLHENGRELRFEYDKQNGSVRVEVRDLEGRLLREIPPSAALDAASGGPFE